MPQDTFKTIQSLLKHKKLVHSIENIKDVHNNTESFQDRRNTDESKVCPHCGIKFSSRKRFLVHIKLHNSESFVCNECTKIFKTKDKYKEHKRRCHTDK